MIKLFNQSIAGLSLTKAKSLIRAPFLNARPKWIGSLVAGFVVVGALVLMLNPAAADNDRHDDGRHNLRLRVTFVDFRAITNGLFTWGGTLAPAEHPDQQIGTFGVHFARTTPPPVGPHVLLHGIVRLPDGQISFSGLLLPEDHVADANGVKNRYAAITGGTGDYWNARGQLNHRTTASGAEEFILTFAGH